MTLIVDVADLFDEVDNLPRTWARVPLGDVCAILNGFAFKSSHFNKSRGIPLIRIRDLDRAASTTYYSGDYESAYLVGDGDLLVGMDGAFRCRRWSGGKALLNQRVCRVSPDKRFLEKTWLEYGLDRALRVIQSATSSVTVQHLSSRDIQKLPFPIPPRAEQRRIVAKLEELLSKAEACQNKLDRVALTLKRFRQSVLTAAFSGKLSESWRRGRKALPDSALNAYPHNDIGWNELKATEACAVVANGSTPRNKPFTKTGDIPFLKIYNIVGQQINFDYRPQFISEAIHRKELKRSVTLPSDVLMNIVGPPLGKVALVPAQFPEWNINQAIVLFRPKPFLLPKFLYFFLCEGAQIRAIEHEYRGSAGQSNISLSQARAFTFLVPSLEEQREILRRIEYLFRLADQIELRCSAAKTNVDQLTRAILAKAFRGELVPQDPKDESADSLVARVRAVMARPETAASLE